MPEPLFGYHGRYLRIDLTTQQFESRSIDQEVLRAYIGGVGLGTYLLLSESTPLQDPFSTDAPLVFVFSPLVGSPLTTSAKFAVVGQSPLTGYINDALSSSTFAINGKKTGYDAIVIVGASRQPTLISIENQKVQFESAQQLWGLSSEETEDSLKNQFTPQTSFACIGPAGENRVRYATISHDSRHAGRGGLGAVMGSKRLKAVSVSGNQTVEFAHPKQLTTYSKQVAQLSQGEATAKYRELGTADNLATFNRLGVLPSKNFQQGTFASANNLTPQQINNTEKRERVSCAACTIGCEHRYHNASTNKTVRVEYENLFALGPLCGISNPDTALQASALCDHWGLDTISTGATIAFAMECAERGLLKVDDWPCDNFGFGNDQALLLTIECIGKKTGIGQLLAEGSRIAAQKIGQGSEQFAPHVKGLEIPGYEPRGLQSMALGFAVGTRGADHNRSGAYQVDFSEQSDRMDVSSSSIDCVIAFEDEAAAMDSLILCKFLRGVFDDKMAAMAQMLQLTTGWDITAQELSSTAQRIVTAKKCFNIQQGWQPEEDSLPSRFFDEPLPTGASQGAVLSRENLRVMVTQYNQARGWDEQGWISEQQLAKLGLLEFSTQT